MPGMIYEYTCTTTWMNLKNVSASESSETQKTTFTMIPFLQHTEKQSYSDRSQVSHCQGLGLKDWLQKNKKKALGGDGNSILIVVEVTQLYIFVKTHQTEFYFRLNRLSQQSVLCLNRLDFNKKTYTSKTLIFQQKCIGYLLLAINKMDKGLPLTKILPLCNVYVCPCVHVLYMHECVYTRVVTTFTVFMGWKLSCFCLLLFALWHL